MVRYLWTEDETTEIFVGFISEKNCDSRLETAEKCSKS